MPSLSRARDSQTLSSARVNTTVIWAWTLDGVSENAGWHDRMYVVES